MMENLLKKETDIELWKSQCPKQNEPKDTYANIYIIKMPKLKVRENFKGSKETKNIMYTRNSIRLSVKF